MMLRLRKPHAPRLRAAAVAALLALCAVALCAAPAAAGTVTNVSVDYGSQSSTRAGEVSAYLHVDFRTSAALAAGGTITIDAPAGSSLSPAGFQLDVGGSGYFVS